ncbi:AAA family ATPase [Nocardioides sp. NPDC000445]|uniref:helix-turn-helix transcriptional regulator n=1 Tax=Nocardioides sp. NPDC000445 TaxID=3154257 RepID=UPI00332DFD01
MGRVEEFALVADILASARAGRGGGALFVTGEPGMGKTAVLERVSAEAKMRVLRLAGSAMETDLEFAGLHTLLRGMEGHVGRLAEVQAAALSSIGGTESRPPDPLVTGIAFLNLLTRVSADEPVLVVVDNLDRLDRSSRQAIMFTAGRVGDKPIAILCAACTLPGGLDVLELALDPLDDVAARALLQQRHADLSPTAADRVLAVAGGSPLAIIELAKQLTTRQRAGVDPLPDPLPLGARLQSTYEAELDQLTSAGRDLVTLLALEDSVGLRTLLSAAQAMGRHGRATLATAEDAGLVVVKGTSVAFRKPLMRSAVLRGSTYDRRRRAHLALAAVLVHGDVADRRAAHLAAAATGPDEHIARLLEQSAARSVRRGGTKAKARMLEEAAELSPDIRDRDRRLLLAAGAAWSAGHAGRAAVLLDRAGSQDERDTVARARVSRLRGLIALGRGELRIACEHLLVAADLLSASVQAPDEAASQDAHQDAVVVPLGDLLRTVYAAWAADLPTWFLAGLDRIRALAAAVGPAAADHPYAEVLNHFTKASGERPTDELGPLLQPNLVLFGSHADALRCLERAGARLRRGQAVGSLPFLLAATAPAAALTGRGDIAAALLVETEQVAARIGQDWLVGQAAAHTAVTHGIGGRAAECRREVQRVHELAGSENRLAAAQARLALGLLAAADGRWEESWARLRPLAGPQPAHPGLALQFAADVVEAALRCDRTDDTAHLREVVARAAAGSIDPDLLTTAEHCEALRAAAEQTDTATVERHFRAATDIAGHSLYARGRALLSYGEWLRRTGRPAEARDPLREAAEVLASVGAGGFAGRAQCELRAAGERVEAGARAALTAQELQVAKRAARGLTNRAIAAQLHISPRTVGYHLYNLFPKLGVSDRRQLADIDLGDEEA